jgi:hypothetical protein
VRDDVLSCLHGFTTWTMVRLEGARSDGGVFAREGVAREKADTRRCDWSGELEGREALRERGKAPIWRICQRQVRWLELGGFQSACQLAMASS